MKGSLCGSGQPILKYRDVSVTVESRNNLGKQQKSNSKIQVLTRFKQKKFFVFFSKAAHLDRLPLIRRGYPSRAAYYYKIW